MLFGLIASGSDSTTTHRRLPTSERGSRTRGTPDAGSSFSYRLVHKSAHPDTARNLEVRGRICGNVVSRSLSGEFVARSFLEDQSFECLKGQVLIFLSNLRMVPRARLSCWFLRRAFGEELVSKFLDSPDCENIHPYAAPFTRCGQQDCEREFYRGLLVLIFLSVWFPGLG